MKTILLLILAVAVGCVTHAQPPVAKPAPPPPPDEQDVFIVAQRPPSAGLPGATPLPPRTPKVHLEAVNVPFKFGHSSSSRRTLVIPKGEPNADFLANAEEDLNVMSVILENAVEMRSEDEGKKALGIDIFSSSSGIKNLLIEGYGAVFTLKTKMPLLPPPTPHKEETKTKEPTNSEWEEARRQLYGPSEIEREIHKAFRHVQTSFSSSEEYDESKVERLKDSLTQALKSAANIRGLSDDHTVTIVVLSSSPISDVRRVVAEAGRGGSGERRRAEVYAKSERSESRSGARLMLQAKKSDVDAYAKDKLNSASFREKIKIQIY